MAATEASRCWPNSPDSSHWRVLIIWSCDSLPEHGTQQGYKIFSLSTEDTCEPCKSRGEMVGGFPLPHRHCSCTRCGSLGTCSLPFTLLRTREGKRIITSPLFLPLDRHHHRFLLSQEAGNLAYLMKLPVSIRFPHRRMC